MKRGLVLLTFAAMFLAWPWQAESKPAKPKSSRKTIEYVVKSGDSIASIARDYSVSVDSIVKWNNLANANHIRKGQKLKLRVEKGVSAKGAGAKGESGVIFRNETYKVKKGDNLGKIAQKHKVSVADLKKWNKSLRKNSDKLKVGQTIIVAVDKIDGNAVSTGAANNGHLVNGIVLPSGSGYSVRDKARSYGTVLTVGTIIAVMDKYANRFPKGGKFWIGDLSRKGGGKFSPHKSHQSGRDVDIAYMRKGDADMKRFEAMNASNFDVEKNWYVIKEFLDTGKTEYIFVDRKLQKMLYEYGKSQGTSDAFFEKYFQYPRESACGVVRHAKGHHDHMHIRFICSANDKGCR